MDFLDSLQPQPPYDATVTLPRELPPAPAGIDLSPAALAALHAELSALRLDCLKLERRSRDFAFLVVGHNEIAALNARLATVVALNRMQRPYHQSSVVAAWTMSRMAARSCSDSDIAPMAASWRPRLGLFDVVVTARRCDVVYADRRTSSRCPPNLPSKGCRRPVGDGGSTT